MKKTTTVRAVIDPEKKRRAGEILAQLGLNHSQAINIFYSLVIENNGLPFPVRLPGGGEKGARGKGQPTSPALDPEILAHLRKSVRINLRLAKGMTE